MKRLFLILVILCTSSAWSQNAFTIEGNVLNGTKVNYSVYEIDNQGLWREVQRTIVDSTYSQSLPLDTYLMVFRSGEDLKHLYLDLLNPGEITLDVNFNETTHPVIYYDKVLECYIMYAVKDSHIKDMYGTD